MATPMDGDQLNPFDPCSRWDYCSESSPTPLIMKENPKNASQGPDG